MQVYASNHAVAIESRAGQPQKIRLFSIHHLGCCVALSDNTALIKFDEMCRILHCFKSMRNRDDRAFFHFLAKNLLDLYGRLHVNGSGCLILNISTVQVP